MYIYIHYKRTQLHIIGYKLTTDRNTVSTANKSNINLNLNEKRMNNWGVEIGQG